MSGTGNDVQSVGDGSEVKVGDVIKNPIPDSAQIGESDEVSYDDDFEYLKSRSTGSTKSNDAAVTQKKVEGESSKPSDEPDASSHPSYPVPPIAEELNEADAGSAEGETTDKRSGSKDGDSDGKKQSINWEERFKGLQSSTDKTIAELRAKLDEANSELEQLRNAKLAIEEFKRDSFGFITKYAPEVAKQIDPRHMIHDTLAKEFANELANGERFNPEEADVPGTFSWKWASRKFQLEEQLRETRIRRQIEEEQRAQHIKSQLESSKAKVMREYGLKTEEQFNREIVEYMKNLHVDYEMVAKLKYFDWHIQRAVNQALKSLGVKSKNGNGAAAAPLKPAGATPKVDDDFEREWQKEFGD